MLIFVSEKIGHYFWRRVYFTKKPANSWTTIREVEAGLINRYHMRPVLIVPVLMPVCPHEVAVTMIQSSSEAYDWALERYPAANKGVWTIQTETWRPVHLILHTEGNVFPLKNIVRHTAHTIVS